MANPFGFGGTPSSVAATAGSGTSTNNLVANTAAVYYWTSTKTKVVVFNHPDSGPALLYGQWNDIADNPSAGTATTSATEWDFVLTPGSWIESLDGIPIKSVGLFVPTGETQVTYLTNFQVRGY